MVTTSEPNQNPEKPRVAIREVGDIIRANGWVWKATSDGWVARRRVGTYETDRQIPTTFDYARENESGGGRETGQPANAADDDGDGNRDGGGGGNRESGQPGNKRGGGGGDRDELRGIPDGGKVWQVGNDYYVVYEVPKSNPPVLLSYKFRDKEEARSVTRGAGIAVDRTLSENEFRKTGAIKSGPADLITNQSEHPWDRFRQDFNREVRFKPWLKDPDFMALIAQSILEGRSPSLSEVQSTDWYQEHSAAERQQLELYYGDRQTWNANRAVAERKARDALAAAGYDGPGQGRLENYLAREVMFGRLPETELGDAVEQLTNPLAADAARTAGFDRPDKGKAVRINGEIYWRTGKGDYRLNAAEEAMFGAGAVEKNRVRGNDGKGIGGFGGFVRSQDDDGADYRGRVDNFGVVEDTVLEYIGPLLAKQWGQKRIAQWAQRMDTNENPTDVLAELKEKLLRIKNNHYRNSDPQSSYEEIATGTRALFSQQWGRDVDETDPIFQRVLQKNDLAEGAAVLRREGINRNVKAVVDSGLSDMMNAWGDEVAESMV